MNNRCHLMFAFDGFAGKIFAVCLVFCLSVIPAFPKDNANVVPPGNWGAVEYLPRGTKISVRMIFGDRMDGKFLNLDAESIRLEIDGKDRNYPRTDVREIWQLRVPDRKLNGALIGMGTGAAAGIIAAYAVNTGGGSRWRQEDAPGPYFLLAGLGLGALVGTLVDVSIKSDRLLYRTR